MARRKPCTYVARRGHQSLIVVWVTVRDTASAYPTLPLLVPTSIRPSQSQQVPILAVPHVPVYTHTNVIYSSLQSTSILGTCSASTIIYTNTSPVGSSAPASAHFSLFALVILIRMWLMAPAGPDPCEVVWSTSQIPATGTQCVTVDEQEC
ncbi:hypothetical protein BD769DRAFT_254882 [Suillus cothurnatus]|nr:hypothetical protein BD769DRAFT_254882 [Suillus cothurnatus]